MRKELTTSPAPQSTVDKAIRVCRMIPDAVEDGRRFRSLLQPISDRRCVTWRESAVGVADDEDVDVGVVHNGEPPHHRRGQSPATAAVDVADLGAELTQSSHHLGRHCAIARWRWTCHEKLKWCWSSAVPEISLRSLTFTEALLLQRDRATRYVSKFVLCFTRNGS